MDNGTIASRYARAIFNYAHKNGLEEKIAGYFKTLSRVMEKTPGLGEAMVNPVLTAAVKEQLLQVAAGAGQDDAFTRILRLILSHKRENFIRWISLDYEDIYKEECNVADIYLTTAAPIDAPTMRHITGRIEKELHKKTIIHTTVNPELIGGYVMEWDTYRYDASLKRRLQQIKQQLIDNYDRTNKNK